MRELFLSFMPCVVAIGLASCSNSPNNASTASAEVVEVDTVSSDSTTLETEGEVITADYTEEGGISASATDDTHYSNFIGTYEFTDEKGRTWVLKANADKTASLGIKNSNQVAYGEWEDRRSYTWDCFNFRFEDDLAKVWFPSGEEEVMLPGIKDGFFYLHYREDVTADNARHKLPIKKL